MTANNDYIAEILREMGFTTTDVLDRALRQAEAQRTEIIPALVAEGLNHFELLKALATPFGMEAIQLSATELDLHAAEWIPAEVAKRYHVAPIKRTDNLLTVAVPDPLDLETVDTLRYVLKYDIDPVVALPAAIDEALGRLYPGTDDQAQSMLVEIDEEESHLYESANTISLEEDPSQTDEPIIRLVNLLILEGFRSRASDIHLEPLSRQFRVRYRIDGVLREVEGPPRRLHPSVISRIKIMSKMKISEKRLPQDGRIELNVMGRELDLRVSAIPTNHGESIVMRILDKEGLMLGLPNLGFLADDQQTFESLVRQPDGITLITGPTGSGKTTTLYACLNTLNEPNRKIITVEDPVEYQLSGINQVQVKSEIGLTFSAALRSMLRQAPNVIMIGEIRDQETAEIAVNAALTGHLVLSTLHTNDAPAAITRLVDMGVKPFLVSSSVRGIMAQRLVRTLCTECKTAYTPTDTELRLLGPAAPQLADVPLYQGAGCNACGQTGYKGRKGIFELLTVNDEVRQMIYAGLPAAELREKARERGMHTLREDGLRKAVAGITSLNEVLRVTLRDAH